MKKVWMSLSALLWLAVSLTGCTAVGEKNASLSTVYLAACVSSLLLLIGYCVLIRPKSRWYLLLFSSITVVNLGYYWLSVSQTLSWALAANRLAYFGSVFLPLFMLMIVFQATKLAYQRWMMWSLLALGTVVFLVAASPGYSTLYYSEVSLTTVNGVTALDKAYGPLHGVYLYYLAGYFIAIVAVTIRGFVKKTTGTPTRSVILAMAVFVNLGVWFIEQLVHIEFEFLAVSYVISELFLLGFQLITAENERLKAILQERQQTANLSAVPLNYGNSIKGVDPDRLAVYQSGIALLTPTEQVIYRCHLARMTTKEILESQHITENTLKSHNRNIYGKLGVSSRRQLMEYYAVLQKQQTE